MFTLQHEPLSQLAKLSAEIQSQIADRETAKQQANFSELSKLLNTISHAKTLLSNPLTDPKSPLLSFCKALANETHPANNNHVVCDVRTRVLSIIQPLCT